jgi:hypothetical protein
VRLNRGSAGRANGIRMSALRAEYEWEYDGLLET